MLKVPPSQRVPNILDSLKLNSALRMAKHKSEENKTDEATAIYRDILRKFPKNKKALEGIRLLEIVRTKKANKRQNPSTEHMQAIVSLYNQERYQETLIQIKDLLRFFPNSDSLYNILGAVNVALQQFQPAIEYYKKAIEKNPVSAEFYYNLGLAFHYLKDIDHAIASYQKAIKIKPDYLEAYCNIGMSLAEKDDLEKAIENYKMAIKIQPDHAGTYCNLGIALSNKGDLKGAIAAYKKALKINPDFEEVYNNIGAALTGISFLEADPELIEIITKLLENDTCIRPQNISKAATSLLKFDPKIKFLLGQEISKVSVPVILDNISKLAGEPLLLKLMSLCPIPDLDLEFLFTKLRTRILFHLSSIKESPEVLNFLSALALQCFTNEYLYMETDLEHEKINALEKSITDALYLGNQPKLTELLCFASYRVIHNYDWCKRINLPKELREISQRLISEPLVEKSLSTKISKFGEINDEVSSKVLAQYQENPFPRWVKLGTNSTSATLSEVIEEIGYLKLSSNEIKKVESPEILIAGCGTGQHSIETAMRFKSSKLLAVDLSLSSLSYAKRKTQELKVNNIDYMQADILNLEKLEKNFDIIESVGVLHHMNDPMSGWRILTDLLNPGGLMRIGLYSEIGRSFIIRILEEIKDLGTGLTNSSLKAIRHKLIHSDNKRLLLAHDFYSLSNLRDLLFHVQEHRFNLPQIKQCLDELGLEFCGFEDTNIMKNFRRNNPDPDELYNLDKWDLYEKYNPNLFEGMYHFWCQKL